MDDYEQMFSDHIWNRFQSFSYLFNNKHITVEVLVTSRDPCRTKELISAVGCVSSQCWLIAEPLPRSYFTQRMDLTWRQLALNDWLSWSSKTMPPHLSLGHLWRATPALKHPHGTDWDLLQLNYSSTSPTVQYSWMWFQREFTNKFLLCKSPISNSESVSWRTKFKTHVSSLDYFLELLDFGVIYIWVCSTF